MVKLRHIGVELSQHFPFTIFGVSAGIMLLGILTFLKGEISKPSLQLFHVFHPLHILFSSLATTAMFWRHERKILKAFIVGFIGSVGICGISDIFIPFVSGTILGVKMRLHVCVIEHPQIVLPFAFMGIITGFIVQTKVQLTIFSHSIHVLISSIASILYLVAFGLVDWMEKIGGVLVFTVLAVIIPCCLSDIIFPLMFAVEDEDYH